MKLKQIQWLTIYTLYRFKDDYTEEERYTPIFIMPILPGEKLNPYMESGHKILKTLKKTLDLPPYTTLVLHLRDSLPMECGFKAEDPGLQAQPYGFNKAFTYDSPNSNK